MRVLLLNHRIPRFEPLPRGPNAPLVFSRWAGR